MGKKEKYILVRVTEKERNILKRKAKKVGLTVSDFVRSSLIHSDNLTINVIDTSVLSKTLFELHKHGVNLNQLAAAANTQLLLQDMPDVSHERRRELVEQIENFVATLKDPYCKALAETRGLMVQLRKQSEVER